MGNLNKKIGTPKIDVILTLEKERNTFLNKLKKRQKTINWAIIILFFVGFFTIIIISIGPFFSVKYKLAQSSFGVSEEKIIDDYYKMSDTENKNLPFLNLEKDDFDKINLEERIKEELEILNGVYGVYVKNINTGEEFSINKEKIFIAASLSKLFVSGTYYQMLEKNFELKNEEIILTEKDKVEGAGNLVSAEVGSKYLPNFLVEEMLKRSDNTAFAMMVRYLGFKNISNFIKDNGFGNTDFRDNTTTPKDIGNFLEKLYRYNLFNSGYSEEMINLMTKTAYEDRLPYYLPKDIKVAHKIGSWAGAYSDAGIVYGEKSNYIIVVMTDGANYEEAVNTIRKLSQVVYDYFNF